MLLMSIVWSVSLLQVLNLSLPVWEGNMARYCKYFPELNIFTLMHYLTPIWVIIYRRSGNFRVKYIICCFLFVAQAHRQKLNHAKNSFTCSRDRIPCQHWRGAGVSAQARECSRHPCRMTDREGTAVGYSATEQETKTFEMSQILQ